jgi:hypothetical protein
MTKKQIAILAGLGLAVVCVLWLAAYIIISEESAYQPAKTRSPAWTPTPRSAASNTPTPTPTSTPPPTPTPTNTPDLTDEYLNAAGRESLDMIAVLEDYEAVAKAGDSDLICSYVSGWQEASRESKARWDRLTPPSHMQKGHDLMGAAFDDFIEAFDAIATSCQLIDQGRYDEATEHVQYAKVCADRGFVKMEAAMNDWDIQRFQ